MDRSGFLFCIAYLARLAKRMGNRIVSYTCRNLKRQMCKGRDDEVWGVWRAEERNVKKSETEWISTIK